MFTIISTSIDGKQEQFSCESREEVSKLITRLRDFPFNHFLISVLEEGKPIIVQKEIGDIILTQNSY